MPTLTKIDSFVENLAKKLIDLGGTGLTVALTNTVHSAVWDELSDLTQADYTFCSTRVLTVSSCVQTGGILKLVCADLVLTATGGAVGPFRYIYIYDSGSIGNKLIGYYDYASSITLNANDTFTIDLDQVNGVLTIQ